MKAPPAYSRRGVLRFASVALSAAIVPPAVFGQDRENGCGVTPRQGEGPFYPWAKDVERDSDLTVMEGFSERAHGELIVVAGRLMDPSCRPIAGARVEIWQACWSGRYNHPSDRNPAALDPNFQYWGVAQTDSTGRYAFKTIKPGAYPVSAGWIRPPHIHFKARSKGGNEITTQMYFAGESLNDADRLLRGLSSGGRGRLIVELQAPPPGIDPAAKLCRFDLTLTA